MHASHSYNLKGHPSNFHLAFMAGDAQSMLRYTAGHELLPKHINLKGDVTYAAIHAADRIFADHTSGGGHGGKPLLVQIIVPIMRLNLC
jgi:hypothetical protein